MMIIKKKKKRTKKEARARLQAMREEVAVLISRWGQLRDKSRSKLLKRVCDDKIKELKLYYLKI